MNSSYTPRSRRRTGIFAHSAWDGLLVGISVAHVAVILGVAFYLDRISWFGLALLAFAGAYLTCLNHQCISHNSIHNPFFVSKRLNRVFNIFNSISMGGPSTMNYIEHTLHHKYNNDRKGADAKTKDNLSIFRYGRDDQPEALWRYALTTHLRLAFTSDYSRKTREINEEWALLVLFGVTLVLINPYSLLFYLCSGFMGMCLSAIENYGEHLNGVPGDRMRDSVSVYNGVYNVLWFNNGYHQEHHYRPGVHWLDMATVTPLLPPVHERHCVKYCHMNNLKRVLTYTAMPGSEPDREERDPGIA